MKVGDIFYSVMQKDNSPFEKPRITKFIVEKIDTAHSYPIVSTKTDKWGRHYAFRECQIHLNYEDAIVEKKKIIAKIEKWEEERREQDRLYFEEQEKKEKQRQIEHDKQVRKEVCEQIKAEFDTSGFNKIDASLYPPTEEAMWIGKGFNACKERLFNKLDQIQGE